MGKSYFFFGGIDRKNGIEDGEVISQVPAYMHKRQIEDLEQSKESLKGQLERHEIPPDMVMDAKERLRKLEEKYTNIMNSKCIFTGTQKDEMTKEFEYIKSGIAESLFTRSDMELGLADAHVEADRMSKPCIKIKNIEMAKEANLRPTKNGMVTRDEAISYYRILGENLYPEGDVNLNTECLRRDRATARGSKYVTVSAEGHLAASTKG
jgi:hypothetical protein